MYSWSLRLNTVLTLGVTVLAALCAVASFTDTLHRSTPYVDLQVLKMGPLERLRNGEDKVTLRLNITADLDSVFTWNTKQLFVFVAAEYSTPETAFNQVSLWDTIIERKEDTKIQEEVIAKLVRRMKRDGPFTYPFQGKDLQGREFNLTMYWNVMPISGVFLTNKVVVPGFQLPQHYS